MDTEFNMVAKTVVPVASHPSTTAGSTGETVLNETAFDVSEIFETVVLYSRLDGQLPSYLNWCNLPQVETLQVTASHNGRLAVD